MAFQKTGPNRVGRRVMSGIAVAGLIASVGIGTMGGGSRAPGAGANPQTTSTTTARQGKEDTMAVKDISIHDIEGLRGKARFIDVREPHEYSGDLGHIAGTELVPLASVGVAMQAWDKNQPIVMICRSGGRSGRAAEALAQSGFTNVMNMTGGMLAWNDAGKPVAR
jgi:rhodanese-related sulfurtransferase